MAQGLGLCTQRLNDRTLKGWHISQAEQTNTHTHKRTHINRLCVIMLAPSLSHNLAVETRAGKDGSDQVCSPGHFVTLGLQSGLHGLAQFSKLLVVGRRVCM